MDLAPQDFNKNMRIQGAKYQPKTAKKIKNKTLSKPKSELLKKRKIIKISLFQNGSLSFSIKIRQKIENFALLKKIQ